MSTPDITDRLAGVLAAPVESLGLDLEAVELSKAGKRSVLRIAVDKDGGVDMDDIAEATKAVSEVLDTSDLMGNGAFTLEVTSPGVDRPLTLPRHWRRNETRLVKVDLTDGGALTGRIVSAADDAAVLDVEGEQRTLGYTEVAKAKIQIEFKREG
ncbi:ribosome maturation factor RimP [Nocardioides marmorisolisilvae]|uniref:ribosome maturation factor RimP n=1 Tax=Nocardioides marmorisolisilvae TaxID=1542737 RepID=UPI001FE4FF20|nr:ribosome maturation factor RimP [Nocardioides marmorisolisilvae]